MDQLGFFSEKDFKISKGVAYGSGCGKCRLYKECKNPKMGVKGQGRKGLMLIGEAPSKGEDLENTNFSNKMGRYISTILSDFDTSLDIDCFRTNAVHCYLRDTKDIAKTIDYCRGRTWQHIAECRPRVIILFGESALKSFLQHRWMDSKGLGSIRRWVGWSIPDRDSKCWVIPTYSPNVLIDDTTFDLEFMSHIAKAVTLLNVPFPEYDNEEKCIQKCVKEDEIEAVLQHILDNAKVIAFDYETTGLKPYESGHKIKTCAIAYSQNNAVAFPIPQAKSGIRLLRKVLGSTHIKKIAHNLMFEDLWSRERLGVQVQNWVHCTQNGAHTLNCFPGIAGLKFQSYVNLGLLDYSSHTEKWKAPSTKDEELYGANAINNIHKADMQDLLLYNGIDALNTLRLAYLQKDKLGLDI